MKKWIGSKLSDLADKKLESLGFIKNEEREHSVFYQKKVEEFNYIHAIDIYFKCSGKDILISYEYDADNKYKILDKNDKERYFSIAVALEYKELFWSWVKLTAMRWKYNWDSQRNRLAEKQNHREK